MITCMLSGTLAKPPEQRQFKAGTSYAVASLRVQASDGDLYASVTAFGELAPVLAGLQRGDTACVVGTAKLSVYEGKDGTHKPGLSITASRIIALTDHQAPPKATRPKSGHRQPPLFSEYDQSRDPFTDQVPC